MKRHTLIWLGVGVLFAAPAAWADGFMAPKLRQLGASTKMVASPRQEAVLATDGQTVQVILRVHFRAGPDELAWIVPVPAKPTKIDKADGEIFDLLERVSAPRFFLPSRGKGGIGCACGGARYAAQGLGGPAVVVEATGTAGIFKYVVLSAAKADELTKWLNDNGYLVPVGAERVFQRYVRGGWHWLAMKVRPEVSDKPTLAPHPIAYSYPDTRLVYPLVISRLSADLTNEIVLYVLADGRYACANWGNATVRELSGDLKGLRYDADSPSLTNYEKLFASATGAAGGHLFVTELARRLDNVGPSPKLREALSRGLHGDLARSPGKTFVTRLRAVMTPKAMDRDVSLVPVAWGEVTNIHYLSDGRAAKSSAAGPLAAASGCVCLLWAGLYLARTPGRRRLAGAACIITAAAAFAMM